MNTRKSLMIFSLAAILLAGRTTMAQSDGEHALEGAWTHHVTPGADAPPGPPVIDTFVTYSAGGTTVEQNGAPGGFGPSVGEWRFARNGEFDVTWMKPIYDPQSGQLVVMVRIRARLRMLSPDHYQSSDITEVYGLDGKLIVSWNATTQGNRIQVVPVN